MVSALTVLGVAEMESRHTGYAELAEAIRVGPWAEPAGTLRELYTRLVFNVCFGNNDDHLRNHGLRRGCLLLDQPLNLSGMSKTPVRLQISQPKQGHYNEPGPGAEDG